MNIKTFIHGGKFDQYQHFAIVTREKPVGIMPLGGGDRYSVCRRFGNHEIKSIFVYGNIIRIEVSKEDAPDPEEPGAQTIR